MVSSAFVRRDDDCEIPGGESIEIKVVYIGKFITYLELMQFWQLSTARSIASGLAVWP